MTTTDNGLANRMGNVVYTTMHDGWRRGEEVLRNRIYVCFDFDKTVPDDERETLISDFVAFLSARSARP